MQGTAASRRCLLSALARSSTSGISNTRSSIIAQWKSVVASPGRSNAMLMSSTTTLRANGCPLFQSGSSFNVIHKAHYAKSKGGKGKKGDDDDDRPALDVNKLTNDLRASLTDSMRRSVDYLTEEFSKLRLGRANPEILNKIRVEGAALPKKGSIFVKDAFTLAITPFDKSHTRKIIEALIAAEMDLNPQADGEHIIVRLPKATDEYRQSLLKQATKQTEDVKASIRRFRQNAMADLKKQKDAIPKDDMKKLENEVQKITDEFTKKAESLFKTKEQQINGQ